MRGRCPSAQLTCHRPSVKYFCDLDYDPFLLMQDQGKQYGFTLSLYEYIETIPTLWNATRGACQRRSLH